MITKPTDQSTESAMAQIRATIEAPAITADPMQRGVTAIRKADEDAMRLWKTAAPKDVKGEIAAYLVNREVIYLHQFPSGKFLLLREAKLTDLMLAEDGE